MRKYFIYYSIVFISVLSLYTNVMSRANAIGEYANKNTNTSQPITSSQIFFTPSPACENLIISQILNAKQEINIIIYSITNTNIVQAIKRAYNNKITIRLIADRQQEKGKNSLVQSLIDYGIDVRISKKHKIEHNKVSIIDKDRVITGSYNYTYNASHFNSENCLLIEDREHKYYDRFNYLWRYYE